MINLSLILKKRCSSNAQNRFIFLFTKEIKMAKRVKSAEEPAKKRQRFNCELPIPALPTRRGTLLVCGQGDMGQLGLGEDEMERKRPTIVSNVKDIVDIKAGGMHSLCLTASGEVYSFGCNDEGALGRDSSEDGSEFVPAKITLPGKSVKVSAGDSHSACLLEDGRVFAWGSFRDSHGNMGLTLEGNKRLPIEVLPGILSCDIASGTDHLVILTCTGKIYTMGCAEQGQLGRVSLRTASGESRRGKTELLRPGLVTIRGIKNADRIWATNYCTFAKEYQKPNICGFGLNNYKQLGINKTAELVISPTRIKFENVKTIAGGQHHTLVLTEENICYAIGRRDYGRLGLGSIDEDIVELQPVKALDGKQLVDVSCGEAQSFAITEDGKVYAWGMGSNLQLGTGIEDDELEPVLISSKQTQDAKVIKVSSGGQHTLFLIANEEEKEKSDLNENQTKKMNGSNNAQPEEMKTEPSEENAQSEAAPPKKGRKKKN